MMVMKKTAALLCLPLLLAAPAQAQSLTNALKQAGQAINTLTGTNPFADNSQPVAPPTQPGVAPRPVSNGDSAPLPPLRIGDQGGLDQLEVLYTLDKSALLRGAGGTPGADGNQRGGTATVRHTYMVHDKTRVFMLGRWMYAEVTEGTVTLYDTPLHLPPPSKKQPAVSEKGELLWVGGIDTPDTMAITTLAQNGIGAAGATGGIVGVYLPSPSQGRSGSGGSGGNIGGGNSGGQGLSGSGGGLGASSGLGGNGNSGTSGLGQLNQTH